MIEIVLDGNSGNEFCGNSYPIIEIENKITILGRVIKN
jgi:hypothetical protein